MKKLLSLVLALMMACMLIPAMAEGQDVTGDWYLTDVSGMNVANLGMSMIVTLNADGTAKVSMTREAMPRRCCPSSEVTSSSQWSRVSSGTSAPSSSTTTFREDPAARSRRRVRR